jgi:cytosine/adenosine deaminase-related metal-dependent hydrolase
MIIKARYIVPIDGPVIENGAVSFENERVTGVGPSHRRTERTSVDYGDAVICPGFVNAHTHLELSLLAGKVPPGPDFIDWLHRLLAARRNELTTEQVTAAAMRTGIEQSLAAGTTCVGDITTAPERTRPILAESPLSGISYGEVIAIGNLRGRLTERLEACMSLPFDSQRLRAGISPHAPYTVEPHALRACAQRAQQFNMPLCIHLLESDDERQFTRQAGGRFAQFLRDIGVWDDAVPMSDCEPVELALRTGVLGPSTVIAHANYVTASDMQGIARSGATVAYCPRTHHAFGHPPHRVRALLGLGINVCLGTDSLASNPTLSILDEMRFVRHHDRDLSSDQILRMGTINGARGLGLTDETGSITLGKRADLVVVPLETAAGAPDWESILETSAQPLAVYGGGEMVLPSQQVRRQ